MCVCPHIQIMILKSVNYARNHNSLCFLNLPMHLVYLWFHSLKEASLLTDMNKTLTHSGAGAQSDLLNRVVTQLDIQENHTLYKAQSLRSQQSSLLSMLG